MAFGDSIIAHLGLDTSRFREGLEKSSKGVEKLNSTLKKVGMGFVGFDLAVKAMLAIYNHAKDLEGALNDNQKAAKRFTEDTASGWGEILDAGVEVMGFFNRIGEGIGRAMVKVGLFQQKLMDIAKVPAFMRGQQLSEHGEEAAEGAERMQRELAEKRKRNEPGKLASVRKEQKDMERSAKMNNAVDDNARINMLLAEQLELQKKLQVPGMEVLEREETILEIKKKGNEISGLYKKLREEEIKKAEQVKKIEEDTRKVKLKGQEDAAGLEKALAMQIKETHQLEAKRSSVKDDIIKKAELEKEIAESQNAAAEKAVQLEEKKKALKNAQHDVTKTQSSIQDARDERSKLSIQDIAAIGRFQAGVSIAAGDDGQKARDALEIQRKAEEARMSGDSSKADELFTQFDKMKGGIEGLRPSERKDPMEALKEQLEKELEQLEEIKNAVNGKFKSQKS